MSSIRSDRDPQTAATGEAGTPSRRKLLLSGTALASAVLAPAALGEKTGVIAQAQAQTFRDFPPSRRPASFTIDQAMEKLKQNIGD